MAKDTEKKVANTSKQPANKKGKNSKSEALQDKVVQSENTPALNPEIRQEETPDKETDKMLSIFIIESYNDLRLNRLVKKGEIIFVDVERAAVLINRRLAIPKE